MKARTNYTDGDRLTVLDGDHDAERRGLADVVGGPEPRENLIERVADLEIEGTSRRHDSSDAPRIDTQFDVQKKLTQNRKRIPSGSWKKPTFPV